MSKSLDAIDQALLALLRQAGRTPLITLAKKVGLSRSATQERIARLEAHGVIAGYTIKAPPHEGLRAWLMVRYAPGTRCADVVPHLRRIPQLRLCHSLAGAVDILALAEVADATALATVRDAMVAVPGVAEVTTAAVMKAHWD